MTLIIISCTGYKEMKKTIKHTRQVYFDKEAFCHSSEVRYLTERIPYDDGFGVSKNFYYAFKRLPEIWNFRKYYQFLNEWGTVGATLLYLCKVFFFIAYCC